MAGDNVPGLDQTPKYSNNLPGVALPNRYEVGRVGQATEALGRSVEEAAQTGAQIYDETQRQYDYAAATQAASDAKLAHNQFTNNLVNQSSDGFVRDPQTGERIEAPGDASGYETIASQYQDYAKGDTAFRTANMNPRQKVMYGEQMGKEILDTTKALQNEGLKKQQGFTESVAQNKLEAYAKDFQLSPVPAGVNASDGYYKAPNDKMGEVQYPNLDKVNKALEEQMKFRQVQGGNVDQPGVYGPFEAGQKMSTQDGPRIGGDWMKQFVDGITAAAGSRAALQSQLKDAPSSAMAQIYAGLDILDGKDPQSAARQKAGLPTPHSAMTSDQISQWKNTLWNKLPEAKDIDKSDYNLDKDLLLHAAGGTQNIDQFINNPLLHSTMNKGAGLGLSVAERIKDIVPAYAAACEANALYMTSGIASPQAMRQEGAAALQRCGKSFDQLTRMMGYPNTEGFSGAVQAQAAKALATRLQERADKINADLIKAAQEIRGGAQGSDSPSVSYAGSAAVSNYLKTKPGITSLFDVNKSTGKSYFETGLSDGKNIFAKVYGPGVPSRVLNNADFQNEAAKLKGASNVQDITAYFDKLQAQHASPQDKENFMGDLVSQGGLPQTFLDARNLATTREQETRYARLIGPPPELRNGMTEEKIKKLSDPANASIYNFFNTKFGFNSKGANTNIKTYGESWHDSFLQHYNSNGYNQSQAIQAANNERDASTGAVGVASEQHSFFNPLKWGQQGPRVPLEFGLTNYSAQERQNITDVLTHAMSPARLAKESFAQPPGGLPVNMYAPSEASSVAKTANFWRKGNGGFTLQRALVDKDNIPTGSNTDVYLLGPDGKTVHTLFVDEATAKAGLPK
jgi:hypothetical protein